LWSPLVRMSTNDRNWALESYTLDINVCMHVCVCVCGCGMVV
jgi:hypothetical protein